MSWPWRIILRVGAVIAFLLALPTVGDLSQLDLTDIGLALGFASLL